MTPVGGFLSKGKKDAPVIVSFDANGRFPAGNDGEKGKCKGNSGSFALLLMNRRISPMESVVAFFGV